ncbi:carbohydrate binding family 9 domain-containing protein [Colwellia sp. BRX10-3]|uniref:carbohydrate binding family 9 domain-containing protein n=1 Tax=Colwellia sp. BRX10-3 TaxID=2759844 RepID=UPI0015F6D172|nr:carbohydrate binding family 9 domain-containing protein [Colwellia sp. BRX10-3]MBA6392222.1 carbohydrate binding family 9 domain-containing protein [Colwellia sp. BRX10-3]
MKFSIRGLSLLVTTFILFIQPSYAQENTAKLAQLNIPHTELELEVDGDLNDAIWQQALDIPLNIVNSPWNNKPSPVSTTAKVIENGDFLYIAFIAQDPNPELIQGFLGDRDTRWFDDLVGFKLDTYNNRRLNYEFFVNPHGVQHDAIFNEMTLSKDAAWDGIWQSAGKITQSGYQVEIAIPYHILNFNDNEDVKTWAIELIRLYPRDTSLRISHIELDRDDSCWLCQTPEIIGFKNAKASKNIMLTPTLVSSRSENREIFAPKTDWQSENDIDAGLDLRWGINANTLLNVTVNPDFSNIESDAGQLSVNKTFSLFYDEKRQFFVENSEYFSSDFDLVYTRNIADPEYGAKLTGTEGKHSYGAFMTNDTQTNIILPGNTGSRLISLKDDSESGAIKYRYDVNDDLSVGIISTLRQTDNYHNFVSGIDSRYRLNDSNSFQAQILMADTKDSAQYTDSGQEENFNDHAFKLKYKHDSEYWKVTAEHQEIGAEFRADLGFMPRADYQKSNVLINRLIYGEPDSTWQKMKFAGQWQILHNENGELLERSVFTSFNIDGPMLSIFDVKFVAADKVGLRRHELDFNLPIDNSIDGNTERFQENQAVFYGSIQPTAQIFTELELIVGDKIDYENNRLGDYLTLYGNVSYNVNKHLEFQFSHTYSDLEADNANVFTENLTELRVSYQFNVNSYLKFNVVYTDIDFNLDNNANAYTAKDNNLSTQLIYAYKINPQTVFYLGYSDNSYQDDRIKSLAREQRTIYSKISYAWLP